MHPFAGPCPCWWRRWRHHPPPWGPAPWAPCGPGCWGGPAALAAAALLGGASGAVAALLALILYRGAAAARDPRLAYSSAGFLLVAAASWASVLAPLSLVSTLLFILGYGLLLAARGLRGPAYLAAPLLLSAEALAAALAAAALLPSRSPAARAGGVLLAASHLVEAFSPLLGQALRLAGLLAVAAPHLKPGEAG